MDLQKTYQEVGAAQPSQPAASLQEEYENAETASDSEEKAADEDKLNTVKESLDMNMVQQLAAAKDYEALGKYVASLF